jgi:hypothetical protein
MSNKAKNLHFEAKQPAFLRRLRGEADTLDAGVSHTVNQDLRRRAIKTSDEDDDPTYVLEESGSTISKAEFDALVSSKEGAPGPEEAGKVETQPTLNPAVQSTSVESSSGKSAAAIGINSKKRKATQVITEDSVREENTVSSAKSTNRPPNVRSKKKPKAIKLSFNDDGET